MDNEILRMKNSRNVEDYLQFLENIVLFQNDILIHMHDDLSILMNIIAEGMKCNKLVLYICRENGLVERKLYENSGEIILDDMKILDIGLGQLFGIEQEVFTDIHDIPSYVVKELNDVCPGKFSMRGIFSGKVDNMLYSLILLWDDNVLYSAIRDTGYIIMNSIRIVVENKLLGEKIIYESEHDILSGLYNRRCYFRRCREEYGKLKSAAVFFMDVNNLKIVNDKYGHDAGDALIKRAAESIRAMESEDIHAYRMGGDEFLMIALNCTEDDVIAIRRQWEEELERVNAKYGMEPCVIAVGEAYAKGSFDVMELCKLADDRMYDDKRKKHGSKGRLKNMEIIVDK